MRNLQSDKILGKVREQVGIPGFPFIGLLGLQFFGQVCHCRGRVCIMNLSAEFGRLVVL